MPAFNNELIDIFDAQYGAYSAVTNCEATEDKAVTLDKDEKRVIFDCYNKELFSRAGGSTPDGKPRKRAFNMYDLKTGETKSIELTIVFPKKTGNELRLYFSAESGFSPPTGSAWFIFTRKGVKCPYIGFMEGVKELEPEDIRALQHDNNHTYDEGDNEYQKAIYLPVAKRDTQELVTTVWSRDPKLAAQVLLSHDYLCQYDKTHKSFISASTGKQYVEAHHLIPISKSRDFSNSLDVHANIIPLCPNCHRAIHFACNREKRKMLTKLFDDRNAALRESGLELELSDLLSYYGA